MDIILKRILTLIPKKENGEFEHGAKKEFAQSIGFKGGEIISEWIAGRNKSYMKYIHTISEKYNVSVDWLHGLTEIKEKTVTAPGDSLSDQESYFIHCLRLMTEEERKCFIAQAKGVTKDRDAFDDNKKE